MATKKLIPVALALAGLMFIASYGGVKGQRVVPDDVTQFEERIRSCIGDAPLRPYEWGAYVSLAQEVGPAAFCASSIPKFLRDDDHTGACKYIFHLKGTGSRRNQFLTCIGQFEPARRAVE